VTFEGRPLPGLRIVANTHYLRAFLPYSAFTDENGCYKIEGLGSGPYVVDIKNDNYFADAKSGVIVKEQQEVSDTDLSLSRGGVITALVTDKDTGHPIQGIEMLLDGEPSSYGESNWLLDLGRGCKMTDDLGRVEFASLPSGIYSVSPYEYQRSEYLRSRGDTQKDIYLETGKEVTVRFTLQRGATASVFVHDEEGRPVSGARLCDEVARGEYRMCGLHLGTPHVAPSRPGFFLTSADTVDIKSYRDNPEVRLTMARGTPLDGRVVDPEGKGVAGALVSFTDPDVMSKTSVGFFAITGKDGEFSIDGLLSSKTGLSGKIRIFAEGYEEGEGQVTEQGGSTTFTIKPKQNPLAATHFIAGRVKNDLGEPIAGAEITVYQRSGNYIEKNGNSDSSGRFRFDGLAEGYVDLLAIASIGETADYMVQSEVDRGDVEIKIERYAHIEGAAIDKVSGTAIPVFSINVDSDRPIERCVWSKSEVRTDGLFSMDVIPNSNLTVTARVKGYMLPKPVKLNLKPSKTAPRIEFRLEKAASMAGVVRCGETPVANAIVYEFHEFPPDSPGAPGTLDKIAVTNAEGEFQVTAIDHSLINIYIDSDNHAVEIVRGIHVKSGQTKTVDVELHRGGAIKGHVYDANGVGLPNVRVFANDESLRDGLYVVDSGLMLNRNRSSSSDGSYESRGMTPGKVRFGVVIYDTPSTYRTYGKTLMVKDGETITADFKPDDPPEEVIGDVPKCCNGGCCNAQCITSGRPSL
jgi:protocatechuate 3,4-dioxygenase beta subunit